jgi:hypothetical protein
LICFRSPLAVLSATRIDGETLQVFEYKEPRRLVDLLDVEKILKLVGVVLAVGPWQWLAAAITPEFGHLSSLARIANS